MAYKITNDCINCGACESECPTGAITSEEGIHKIDPDKCTECIDLFDFPQCAYVACLPDACVPDPAHRETKEQLRAKWKKLHPDVKPGAGLKPETLEAQVVVLGAGGAGLSAAVAAAEEGADVILLEKRRRPGGNSRLAGQLFGIESPVQKRMNIDIKKDELFRVAMKFARWTINPRIVRAFMDKSADTIRWFEEKGVTNFVILGRERPDANPIYMTSHCPAGDMHGGAHLIRALVKACEGLGVRVLYETRAKELLTGDKKGVTGVRATTEGGQELIIKASSVIIATGGYGGNKELLKKYCPRYHENMIYRGVPNMGDGLLMAMKIGAATEGLGTLMAEVACAVPWEGHKLMTVAQEPDTLWVNKRGERFMDEAFIREFNYFEGIGGIVQQPDCVSYTIFDERKKQKLIESGPIKGFTGYRAGEKTTTLPELLQAAAERGNAKISDSWDDIARWIGVEPEVLKATIDEYNSSCEKGHDEIFAKSREYLLALSNPPYYAIRCVPQHLGTYNGIKINHHMQVLDHKDNPIPSLYAVGADAGGTHPETYNQNFAASAMGFAFNSGRIAGENAAKLVLGK